MRPYRGVHMVTIVFFWDRRDKEQIEEVNEELIFKLNQRNFILTFPTKSSGYSSTKNLIAKSRSWLRDFYALLTFSESVL